MNVEIIHEPTGAVIVCDTLKHCLTIDDWLAGNRDRIIAALRSAGEYRIGGGLAEGFIMQLAPAGAIVAA